mmetsp:Transcript_108663/g.249130  ORF Transcript_108663/g.249130 Transcript_108663/m.249130 type:complete len:297 (-) Transcript_108663:1372-2262(-)
MRRASRSMPVRQQTPISPNAQWEKSTSLSDGVFCTTSPNASAPLLLTGLPLSPNVRKCLHAAACPAITRTPTSPKFVSARSKCCNFLHERITSIKCCTPLDPMLLWQIDRDLSAGWAVTTSAMDPAAADPNQLCTNTKVVNPVLNWTPESSLPRVPGRNLTPCATSVRRSGHIRTRSWVRSAPYPLRGRSRRSVPGSVAVYITALTVVGSAATSNAITCPHHGSRIASLNPGNPRSLPAAARDTASDTNKTSCSTLARKRQRLPSDSKEGIIHSAAGSTSAGRSISVNQQDRRWCA